MAGNGDGKIEIGIVELGENWVMFRAGITPSTDLQEVPRAINEIMTNWLKERTNLHVRETLPITEEGNTVAVHIWFGR